MGVRGAACGLGRGPWQTWDQGLGAVGVGVGVAVDGVDLHYQFSESVVSIIAQILCLEKVLIVLGLDAMTMLQLSGFSHVKCSQ